MGQAIAVRTDYTSGELRQLAKRAKDAAQARRLLDPAFGILMEGQQSPRRSPRRGPFSSCVVEPQHRAPQLVSPSRQTDGTISALLARDPWGFSNCLIGNFATLCPPLQEPGGGNS